MTHSN